MSNKENEPDNGRAFRMGYINKFDYGSDEDTEDASETAMIDDEQTYTQIKDQVYRDKLADLKSQLEQLKNFTLPAYVEGANALKEEFEERTFRNQVFYAIEVERVKREHQIEQEAAHNEFNQKRVELKENIITKLEEERKMIIETERNMDIITDPVGVLQNPNRKLRRRANDLSATPELKRRKTLQSSLQIKLQLTDDEIAEDLQKISEGAALRLSQVNDSDGSSNEIKNSDIRVENGKLYYEKYWYHRGQQIYYEEDGNKISAVISTISPTEVLVKRTSDNEKHQIYISELLKGNITLKRRSA